MKSKLQRTFTPTPAHIWRDWFVVDATDQTLGRLASDVAQILRGKHKPIYAPHMDCGDFVVVVNADKVRVTGKKEVQKSYFRHSGYPGGLREMTFLEMQNKFPERIVVAAVRGMLPKNRLGRRMMGKLKVYAGPEHPHAAQKPLPLEVGKKVEAR